MKTAEEILNHYYTDHVPFHGYLHIHRSMVLAIAEEYAKQFQPSDKEVVGKVDLGQLFRNNSDCYADTWFENSENRMQEGEVVQAMTEERFVEIVTPLLSRPSTTDIMELVTDEEIKKQFPHDMLLGHDPINYSKYLAAIWCRNRIAEKIGGGVIKCKLCNGENWIDELTRTIPCPACGGKQRAEKIGGGK